MRSLYIRLLRITGLHAAMVRFHLWRLRVAQSLMQKHGSEMQMPVWCSSRLVRHQRALLSLGFLVEREFELRHRAISGRETYRAFCDLMRSRFPSGSWSCAASGRRVVVTAPTSQLPEWKEFVEAYDLQTV
jgi:hypothetical protein